jgi:hypothetical protein
LQVFHPAETAGARELSLSYYHGGLSYLLDFVSLATSTFGFRHHFARAGGFARPQPQTAVFLKRQAILHKSVVVVRQEYDVPEFCMIETVGFPSAIH